MTTAAVSASAGGLGNVAIFSSSSIDAGSSFCLGEAIALRQRRHFLGIDPVHQAVEVGAQAGVGPGAVRRLEQDVERLVEFAPRPIEVARP